MSALAGLFNVPATAQELNIWSFQHMANHRDINRTILEKLNIQLPEYILDPVNPQNMQVWLYQHQRLHQDMDSILGISGYDLLDVNWQDQNELAGWIVLNATEHREICNALGIA